MQFAIKWLDEQFKDATVVTMEQELQVTVPDHAVRVGEAMVFEAFGWSNHPACDQCQSGEPCRQLVGVYFAHRTARVSHSYDRAATSNPKPWPPAEKVGQ